MRSLINGFTLFSPERFVPWEITEVQLTAIFDGLPLKHITTGYFVLDCEPFAGLQCSLGFHLHSAKVLTELEFFRNNYSNQKKSYDEFQLHLETAFGQPTHTGKGSDGFPSHIWLVHGARIEHHVIDRFGPEEHVRIIQL
jgi:hypothetical protein